jgi:hypothetical protein
MYLVLKSAANMDGSKTLCLFSMLSGAVFVFYIFRTSDLICKSLFEKAAMSAGIFSTGAMLHFFGYMEIYAPTLALLTIYTYYSLKALRNEINPVFPVILFIVSMAMTLMSVYYFFSAAYLFYVKVIYKKKIVGHPAVAISGLVIIFAISWIFMHNLLLLRSNPLLPDPLKGMMLFSFVHYWEYLNGQILAAGPGFAVFTLFALSAVFKTKHPDKETTFLLISSLSSISASFAVDMTLGSLDWDLMAIPALTYSIFNIRSMFNISAFNPFARILKPAVVTFVSLTFLFSIPWFALNAGDKSISRFEHILIDDPGTYWISHPPEMCIAIAMTANRLDSIAFPWYKKAFEKFPDDPRMAFNYAGCLNRAGKKDSAIAVLSGMTARFPLYLREYIALYIGYLEKNDYLEAMHSLYLMYNAYNDLPQKAMSNVPPAELKSTFIELAVFFAKNSRYHDAEKIINTVLSIDRNDRQALEILRKIKAETKYGVEY